jgi:CDP-glucose 4,6-dehydratase
LENLEVKLQKPNQIFWRGRRVLLTGHSGFKGAWLSFWLARMGAIVRGVSLEPETKPNLFSLLGLESSVENNWLDIRDETSVRGVFESFQPEVVLHLAAQALVRPSYSAPVDTFSTNIIGTLHVLDSARKTSSVRSIVAVTTDKVYQNHEKGLPFEESDPLGGHDPYSASKAGAEMVISSYRKSFFEVTGIGLASARAGNVIGGGDWSVDRILPDAVRAWSTGQPLHVRNPRATRPWQHVLEPLAGYLCLAEHIFAQPESAQDFNFGPDPSDVATVMEVVTKAKTSFGCGNIEWGSVPDGLYEAQALTLDNTKAKRLLGIHPTWNMETAVARTMNWYRLQNSGHSAVDLCEKDLHAYLAAI